MRAVSCQRASVICSGKRMFRGRGTYDTKSTGVGNRRGELSIANPLHTTLDDGDSNPESFCESCPKRHDAVIMCWADAEFTVLPC